MNHGTPAGYAHHRCGCDRCREAWRQYCADMKARAHTRPTPDDAHGRVTGYNYWGCRCDRCKAANARQSAAYRRRTRADYR